MFPACAMVYRTLTKMFINIGKVNCWDGSERIDTVAIIDLAFLGNPIQIEINLIFATLPREAKARMAMVAITGMQGAQVDRDDIASLSLYETG